MKRVRREDLLDWVTYEERRGELRAHAMAEKDRRRIVLGEHLTFLFENFTTIRYQVQEMIRVERMVRAADIEHELETYNELLGAPGELGCTLLIAVEDPVIRAAKLREWLALPEHVYLRLPGERRVRARFDARQLGEDRLSSVQYLKFDTGGEIPLAVGADHPDLAEEVLLTDAQRRALEEDLKGQP